MATPINTVATSPRKIGLNERKMVFHLIETLMPQIAVLGENNVVGKNADVEALIQLVPMMGRVEIEKVERDIAHGLAPDRLRKAALWLAELETLRQNWRTELDAARAADAANAAPKREVTVAPVAEEAPTADTAMAHAFRAARPASGRASKAA